MARGRVTKIRGWKPIHAYNTAAQTQPVAIPIGDGEVAVTAPYNRYFFESPPVELYRWCQDDGRSYGGFQWSLPTQNEDGSWTPGDWMTAVIEVDRDDHDHGTKPIVLQQCVVGLHAFNGANIAQWSSSQYGENLYAFEADGPVSFDGSKWVAYRARLTRGINVDPEYRQNSYGSPEQRRAHYRQSAEWQATNAASERARNEVYEKHKATIEAHSRKIQREFNAGAPADLKRIVRNIRKANPDVKPNHLDGYISRVLRAERLVMMAKIELESAYEKNVSPDYWEAKKAHQSRLNTLRKWRAMLSHTRIVSLNHYLSFVPKSPLKAEAEALFAQYNNEARAALKARWKAEDEARAAGNPKYETIDIVPWDITRATNIDWQPEVKRDGR